MRREPAPPPFRYRDQGALATIGRHSAIADLGWIRLTGPVAWVLWGIVHIFFLIGFRNRMAVFLNWIWAWLTYGRGARLITGDTTPLAAAAKPLHARWLTRQIRTRDCTQPGIPLKPWRCQTGTHDRAAISVCGLAGALSWFDASNCRTVCAAARHHEYVQIQL